MNKDKEILKYFEYTHLPPKLKHVSKMCSDLAHFMVNTLADNEELDVGLRKLLEAKDCFVRAKLSTKLVIEEQSSDTVFNYRHDEKEIWDTDEDKHIDLEYLNKIFSKNGKTYEDYNPITGKIENNDDSSKS